MPPPFQSCATRSRHAAMGAALSSWAARRPLPVIYNSQCRPTMMEVSVGGGWVVCRESAYSTCTLSIYAGAARASNRT